MLPDTTFLMSGTLPRARLLLVLVSWIFERPRPGHDDPDVPDLAVDVGNNVISISRALLGGAPIGRRGLGLWCCELPSRRPPISGTVARRTPEPVEAMVQDSETQGAPDLRIENILGVSAQSPVGITGPQGHMPIDV